MEKVVIGVDQGGSTIKVNAVDDGGVMLFDKALQIESFAGKGNPRRTIGQMVKGIDLVLDTLHLSRNAVLAVGLDSPGPADRDGVISTSGNMPGWEGFPVRRALHKRIEKPVFYTNDGNAGAFAEYMRRKELVNELERQTLIGLFPGTGLGAGKVVNGVLIHGDNGAAMEAGHMFLPGSLFGEEEFIMCPCGKPHHAEAFISLKAVDKQLRRELSRRENCGHPLNLVPDVGIARALLLRDYADIGDELALKIFWKQAAALGLLCTSLACADDPTIFVIGGGLADAKSEEFKAGYLERVRASFNQWAMEKYKNKVRFEWAIGGDSANSYGVALYALTEFQLGGGVKSSTEVALAD